MKSSKFTDLDYRLNRYAQNWAWYLGHHWATRNPSGDQQITFNYVKALSDWITNFTFSRGVEFSSVKQYQHTIPSLLKRIWEVDNEKAGLLWEMGNMGGVSGDVFAKVAYDPIWTDSVGTVHPGRVRILPINPAFAFPEFHPHDRDRMVRFKLKYRFWATSAEGTRQVYTYVEVLTDDKIEEYINDELIDSRPNPLGMIPIVHQPNILVSSSPWGLSDIADIISLNREYNEKATDISEIINYHSAPVTIIKGAKASNLEKGARKVWGGLPKDADVFNLTNGVDLAGPLEFLKQIKQAMHELTGVPESALGQMQPISNTSGVALSIMYMPAMQRYEQKKLSYTRLLKRINELALKTLFVFEPETLIYDPNTEGILRDGQDGVIDPLDPMVYQNGIEWTSPLPVDALIKLNEIQMMMSLGLESKRGALKALSEAFPDEKMQEIFEELVRDARDQGALDLLHSQITAAIVVLTGIDRSEGGPVDKKGPQEKDADGSPIPSPQAPPLAIPPEFAQMTEAGQAQAMSDLVTQAYGTKLGTRIPTSDS
jgi:hypothetical protein